MTRARFLACDQAASESVIAPLSAIRFVSAGTERSPPIAATVRSDMYRVDRELVNKNVESDMPQRKQTVEIFAKRLRAARDLRGAQPTRAGRALRLACELRRTFRRRWPKAVA